MDSIAESVAIVVLLGAPIAAYLRAVRNPNATRLYVVAASALGGGMAGLAIAIGLAVHDRTLSPGLVAWAFGWFLAGGVVGVLGLIARAVGQWLHDRP